MRSLYPHEGKKEMPIDFTTGKYPRMFFFPMRVWDKGEEKPVPPYSAIVYKEGDEVRAEDRKGRKIASGASGVDDASVIQSAIDSVANAGGGKVFIRAGTYIIPSIPEGSWAIIVESGIEVIGEGEATIIRLADGLSVSSESGAVRLKSNSAIYNLILDGNKDAVSGDLNGLELIGSHSKAIGVHVKGWTKYGIRPLNSEGILIHECIGESCGWSNFMAGNIKNSIISNCIAFNAGHSGISLDILDGCTIIGNTCYENTYCGIRLGEDSKRSTVTGNVCYGNSGPGIRLHGPVSRCLISGNVCLENEFVGIGLDGESHYNVISNNFCLRNKKGIRLEAASHNIIVGNLLMENYATADPSGEHVLLAKDCHYNFITGNILRIGEGERQTAYGIYISSSTPASTNNRIFDNDLYDSAALQIIYDGGENTIIRGNFGWITENSGTQTFDGDGSTKDFPIGAHGLVITDPSKIVVKVSPVSQDAIDASPCVGYVDPNDHTKIRVKFDSAPASGSDNVKITWEAIVI